MENINLETWAEAMPEFLKWLLENDLSMQQSIDTIIFDLGGVLD